MQAFRRAALLALLAGLAVAGNLLNLPLFFGIHVLAGSVFGVLALLLFGHWGLLPGVLASLVTVRLWGHPWAVLIFVGELLWLDGWLQRTPPDERDNGRLILADILYWLVLGLPLVLLLYGRVMGMDASNVQVAAIKQGVNGVVNTAIASALLLAVELAMPGRRVSIRGVGFAGILMAIVIPSLGTMAVTSRQLERATEHGQLEKLMLIGERAASANAAELPALTRWPGDGGERIAFRRSGPGGLRYSSDPALFQRLDRDFHQGFDRGDPQGSLTLLIPRQPMPQLKRWVNGYWMHQRQLGSGATALRVEVVEPAREIVSELQQQSSHWLTLVGWIVLSGALLAELLGRVMAREFQQVLQRSGGTGGRGGEISLLSGSRIAELDGLVRMLNNRITRVNSLTRALRRSNLALKSSKQQLQKLSTTDPLTGCGNRRELFRRLDEEIRRSRRMGAPLACIGLDVDHFKWINDGHGHPAGDLVLQAISATLRQRLRGGDCLCRSGGEEFTLLLPGCTEAAALKLAEELRLAIRDLRIPYADQSLQVSVSLGVTGLLSSGDDGESLLSRADRALYRAKQEGRDRVVLFGDG